MGVHLLETLRKSDPIELWVEKIVNSSDSQFNDMCKEERIEKALDLYYESQRTEEAPIMAPKNVDIRPRLTIVRSVDSEARRGSVSLMGNGNVLEKKTKDKDILKKDRAVAITKLSLPKTTDESIIESYVEYMIAKTQHFPSSIQVVIDTFEEFNKELNK